VRLRPSRAGSPLQAIPSIPLQPPLDRSVRNVSATFKEFSTAMLTFLREEVPKNWHDYGYEVADNFRVINPTEFRITARTGYNTGARRPSAFESRIPAGIPVAGILGNSSGV
jgi:hypothetical protein